MSNHQSYLADLLESVLDDRTREMDDEVVRIDPIESQPSEDVPIESGPIYYDPASDPEHPDYDPAHDPKYPDYDPQGPVTFPTDKVDDPAPVEDPIIIDDPGFPLPPDEVVTEPEPTEPPVIDCGTEVPGGGCYEPEPEPEPEPETDPNPCEYPEDKNCWDY